MEERQVVIITNGFGAVVEAALEKADLLRYFSEALDSRFTSFHFV